MKTMMIAAIIYAAGFAASSHAGQSTIIGSKHDLSIGTANSIESADQNQSCVFCHVPYSGVSHTPLWSSSAGAVMKIYTGYNSATVTTSYNHSIPGNDNSSLLCLSCHSLGSGEKIITNAASAGETYGGSPFPVTAGNRIGRTNDHPVGINYDAIQRATGSAGLFPSSGGKVGTLRLFASANGSTSSLECSSCHSVHDNSNSKFLAKSNTNSALCITCHVR